MKRKAYVAALVAFVTWSCAPSPEELAKRAAEEDNIREVVFRHLFTHNHSSMQQNAAVYFLSVGSLEPGDSRDPSDGLMKKFVGHTPVVRGVTRVTPETMQRGTWAKDTETGEVGLIFFVEEIKWLSDRGVDVKAGYYELGDNNAAAYRIRVVRRDDQWEVEKQELLWIS
jgi:hypothetical protein